MPIQGFWVLVESIDRVLLMKGIAMVFGLGLTIVGRDCTGHVHKCIQQYI